MISKKACIFLVFIGLFLAGCFGLTTKVSPSRIESITTEPIEGNLEDIYDSCIAVFEGQGFKIVHTEIDMDKATVLANLFEEISDSRQFCQKVWYGYVYYKGSQLELMCKIQKITDNYSDVKISVRETDFSQWGRKGEARYIYDEELYRNLFNDIKAKVAGKTLSAKQ